MTNSSQKYQTTSPTNSQKGAVTSGMSSRWIKILGASLIILSFAIAIYHHYQPLNHDPNRSIAPSHQQNKSLLDIIEDQKVVHQFNRNKLLNRIKSIVTKDYFRYIKVNLDRPCKLWCDQNQCNLRDCKVKTLSDPDKCPIATYDDNNKLATVDTKLPDNQLDLLTDLFDCNDNDDHNSSYVDLMLNPERFTGYSGESAHRIWRAIYHENCFVTKPQSPFSENLCYEERIFYEVISGLHTSINIHLCAEYPSAMLDTFEPNLNEFFRRFDGHNDYIENLYKLYHIELKALNRSKPFLMKRAKWPDSDTKSAIQDLLTVVERYNIDSEFQDLSFRPSHVSQELAIHFRNITTTIIDCVGCAKCKLWGKVQLRGLGTALKILYLRDLSKISLNHQEISSLVNSIARLSQSIWNLEQFRDLHLKKSNNKYIYR